MAKNNTFTVGSLELKSKLENLSNIDMKKTLEVCAIKVRDDAKQKVVNRHGELEKSINYEFIDDDTVVIGSNKEYAPYVEIGTGIFAGEYTNGMYNQFLGTGRQQVPWAWPATEEDVKRYGVPMSQEDIKGIDGGDNYYNVSYDDSGQAWIWTKGQKAQPYLLPAFLENETWIMEQLGADIIKEIKK